MIFLPERCHGRIVAGAILKTELIYLLCSRRSDIDEQATDLQPIRDDLVSLVKIGSKMTDASILLAKAEKARRLARAGYDSLTKERLEKAAADLERQAIVSRADDGTQSKN